MMRKLLIIFFWLLVSAVSAQETDAWKILSEVRFETMSTGEDGYEMDVPRFSERLKSYNGKKITLKGYLIPLSEMGGKQAYMLSSLPFNSCYFCGGAGPETVIEIETKQIISFTTNQIIMEGVLVLNEKDLDHHMYILKQAKRIENP
jgi:hypothetical protein